MLTRAKQQRQAEEKKETASESSSSAESASASAAGASSSAAATPTHAASEMKRATPDVEIMSAMEFSSASGGSSRSTASSPSCPLPLATSAAASAAAASPAASPAGLHFHTAMANPCMLLMLRCSDLHARVRALRVCRRWHHAVKRPAVWAAATLDLTDISADEPILSSRLPWLQSLITRITIGEDGLLARPTLLVGFNRLHTLHIQWGATESAPSQPLVDALRQLRLREFGMWLDPEGSVPLFDAMFGPAVGGANAVPLLHAWSETLQTLQVANLEPILAAHQLPALLSALACENWPVLTFVKFAFESFINEGQSLARILARSPRPPHLPSARLADALQRFILLPEWWQCGSASIVSTCRVDPLGHESPHIEVERMHVSVLEPQQQHNLTAFHLPQAAALENLTYFTHNGEFSPTDLPSVHALFTTVRGEQLPKLAKLQLHLRDNSAASQKQFDAIVGMMQSMHVLTDLELYAAAHNEQWSWQTAVHQLPSLSKLRLNLPNPHYIYQYPPLPANQPAPPPADAILSSITRCNRLQLLELQGDSAPINAVLQRLEQEYSSRSADQRPPLRTLFLLFFPKSAAQLDVDALRALADLLPSLTRLDLSMRDSEPQPEAAVSSAPASELHGLQSCWRAITVCSRLGSLAASFGQSPFPAALGECWGAERCFPQLSRLRLDHNSNSSNAAILLQLLRLPSLTDLELDQLSPDDFRQLHDAIANLAQQQPQRAPIQLRSPRCLSHTIRLETSPDD